MSSYTPDLIIGTVPALPTAVVTAFASMRFKKPYVIDLRDAWPDLLRESSRWNKSTGKASIREKVFSMGPLQVMKALTGVALRGVLKYASGLIVTSAALERELQQRHADPKDSYCQCSVVIRNVFPPLTRMKVSPTSGRPLNSLNVLYAGTIGRAQNLENAINAVRIALSQGVCIRLRFVGAGAAKAELRKLARDIPGSIEFVYRHPADELDSHYSWADTALVHLTDWPALNKAVPSKTYELMSIGLHITAVADGETAKIVDGLDAGHVVRPESPRELAALWESFVKKPDLLNVGDAGAQWVKQEREVIVPKTLHDFISKVTQS